MTTEMHPGDSDPVAELVRQLEPRLKQILMRFRIPVANAEAMLEDCLMVLLYRQDQIAKPGRWLQRSLRYRCLRHWRSQQRQLCRVADGELARWLEDEAVSPSERHSRRRMLETEIRRLPPPCQSPLRGRFGLGTANGHDTPGSTTGNESPWQEPMGHDGGRAPLDGRGPQDPYVRSLTRLVRQMAENANLNLEGLRLLSVDPP